MDPPLSLDPVSLTSSPLPSAPPPDAPPCSPAEANSSGAEATTSSTADHKPLVRSRVRVERDWSEGDQVVQFWSGWSWELEGKISPTTYQNTLNSLNTILASAHDPVKSMLDNTLAILTVYLSRVFTRTHYQKEMEKFDRVIVKTNRETFNPAGLNLLHPRANAYLFLEIEFY